MSRVRFNIGTLAILIIALSCGNADATDFDLTDPLLQGTAVEGTQFDDTFSALVGPDELNPPTMLIQSLSADAGNDFIHIQVGTISGTAGPYALDGGDGDDLILLSSYNFAGTGNRVQVGGDGATAAALGSAGPYPDVTGGAGNDTITVNDAVIYGNLLGGDGDDDLQVFGTDGTHVGGSIVGGDGTDIISVFGAATVGDSLIGGAGNDTITVTGTSTIGSNHLPADDVDVIDAGDGNDMVSVDLTATINGNLSGGSGMDTLILHSPGDVTLDSGIEIKGFNILTKTGSGTLTIDQDLSTGSITLESSTPSDPTTTGGSLVVATGRTLSAAGDISINSGSTFTLNAGSTLAPGVTNDILVGNGTFTDNSGNNLDIEGTASITQGTFTTNGNLTAANASVAEPTANTSTMAIAGDLTLESTLNSASTGNLSVNGGTLTVGGDTAIGRSFTLNGGTATFNGLFAITHNPADTEDTGDMTVTGSTAVFNGASSIGRDLTVNSLNALIDYNEDGTIGQHLSLTEKNDTVTGSEASDTTKVEVDIAAGKEVTVQGNMVATNNSTHTETTKDKTMTITFGDATSKLSVTGTAAFTDGIINSTASGLFEAGSVWLTGGSDVTVLLPNIATSGDVLVDAGTTAKVTGDVTLTGGSLNVTGASTLTTTGTININENAGVGGDLLVTNGSTLIAEDNINVQNDMTVGDASTFNGVGGITVDVDGDFDLQSTGMTDGTFTLNLDGNGTVRSGATLGGDVTISGTGTMTYEPGSIIEAGNSIGTQNIDINTVWNDPTLIVEYDDTTSDNWVVADARTLTINGGEVVPTPIDSIIRDFTQHDYLFIEEGAAGATITVNSPLTLAAETPVAFTYGISTDGDNQHTLEVTRNRYEDVATTENQQKVGTVFTGQVPGASGDVETVIMALDTITSQDEFDSALDQLGPEPYANLPAINFSVANMFGDQIVNRMMMLAERSDCPPARAGCGSTRTKQYDPRTGQCSPYTYFTDDAGQGFWIQNLGNWDRQRNLNDRLGWESSLYGVMLGYDKRLGGMIFGAEFAWASQRIEFFDRVRVRDVADYFNSNIYLGWSQCGDFLLGGMGYTYAANHVTRQLSFDDLNRTTDANAYNNILSMYFKGGKAIPCFGGVLTPTMGLRYNNGNVQGFSETGTADSVALTIDNIYRESLQGDMGARFSFDCAYGSRVEVYGEWVHEFLEREVSADGTYDFGDAISLYGIEDSREAARIGTRIDIGDPQGFISGYLRYDALLRSQYQAHGVAVGALIRF